MIRLPRKTPMPAELPPDQDKPGVSIPPPLLFILPIVVFLALERFVATSFAQGALPWAAGLVFVVAGTALCVGGFYTQKRAGTDPIPFNPSTCIVAHGPYRFSRNPM